MNNIARISAVLALAACVTVSFAGGGGGGGRGGRGGAGAGGGFGATGGFGGQAGALGPGGGFNNAAGAAFGGAQMQPGGRGRGLNNALTINVDVNFYTNEYTILAQQIALTDEQRPKVRAKVDAMNAELQALLRNAQSAAPDSATSPDLRRIKLEYDYLNLAQDHQIKINSELTEEQKIQWEDYKLHRMIDPRIESVYLTEDQKGRIKNIISDAAKALAKVTDGKELDAITGRVYRRIISEVLTETQVARLTSDTSTLPGGRGMAVGAVGGRDLAAGQAGAGNFGMMQGRGGAAGMGGGGRGAAGGGMGTMGGMGGGGRGGMGGGMGGARGGGAAGDAAGGIGGAGRGGMGGMGAMGGMGGGGRGAAGGGMGAMGGMGGAGRGAAGGGMRGGMGGGRGGGADGLP